MTSPRSGSTDEQSDVGPTQASVRRRHVMRTEDQRAKVQIASDLNAVPAARAFLTRLLGAWDVPADQTDNAALLTTELLSNAIRHGRGRVLLELCLVQHSAGGAALHVRVVDDSQYPPRLGQMDLESESGRGMWLVDAIAEQWGSDIEPPPEQGKTVWFDLIVRNPSP